MGEKSAVLRTKVWSVLACPLWRHCGPRKVTGREQLGSRFRRDQRPGLLKTQCQRRSFTWAVAFRVGGDPVGERRLEVEFADGGTVFPPATVERKAVDVNSRGRNELDSQLCLSARAGYAGAALRVRCAGRRRSLDP